MSRIGDILKKSQMNMLKMNFHSVLNSRILLYFILLLSVADLYIFAVNGEILFVSIFIIIGFLTSFFSKNMTVILFIAMTMTNILRFGKDVRHDAHTSGENVYVYKNPNEILVQEGLDNMETEGIDNMDTEGLNNMEKELSDEPEKITHSDNKTNHIDEKININTHTKGHQNLEGGDEQYLSPSSIKSTFKNSDDEAREDMKKVLINAIRESETDSETKPDTMIKPDNKKMVDIKNKIKGLDNDTVNLLEKQKKLMENMENLNPLFENAEKFLERFKVQNQ